MKTPLFKKCSFVLIAFLIGTTAFAQVNIKGTVKDQKGDFLPGASVLQKGTANGTITDELGRFHLNVPEGAVLVFRYQGYLPQEIKLQDSHPVEVLMEEDVQSLDNVVVTATRSPREVENVPQKVAVISKKDIDKTIATEFTDLLKKTAGVDVIQYPGLLSGIGIRGFRPQFSGINQRTLLLIDGRPAGATNMASIGLNNIQRIEVLKGPASALYGAQAMGGVVNIITKRSYGDINGQVSGGVGSFGIAEGGFSIGGNVARDLDFDISFKSHAQSKDFRLGDDNLFRSAFGWGKAKRILWTEAGKEEIEVDDERGDGNVRPNTSFSNYSGAVRVGYDFNEQWRVDVKSDRFVAKNVNTPGDIQYEGSRPGLKDMERYGGDIILTGELTGKNHLTSKIFTSSEQNTSYRLSVNDTTAIRTQYVRSEQHLNWVGAQLMDRQKIGEHFVTVGLDYNKVIQENFSYNDKGEASTVSSRRPNFSQQNTGAYLQGEMNFLENKLNVTLGLRNETVKYSVIGTESFPSRNETNNVTIPSVGVNYNVMPNLFLHSTFGTAFTTVGVFEIAGYDERVVDSNPADGVDTVDVWVGNPDLKNQESRTFDFGARYVNEKAGLSADITYFHTAFDNNIISRVTRFPDELSESNAIIRNKNSYTNAQGTTLTGLEFDLRYRFKNAGIDLFTSAVCIIKAKEIKEIYRQPEPLTLDMHNVAAFTMNYGVEYNKLSWFSARLTGRYVGRRVDTDWSYYLSFENGYGAGNYADIQYPAFMVADFVTSFRLKNYQLSLLVNNLTDENYYEKRGFSLMGRNYLLRFTVNI